MNDKGFSLTELMVSLTILAFGLLALAQLQIVSMQGSSASRQFSTATNLARGAIEAAKVPGVFMATGGTAKVRLDMLEDDNPDNAESTIAPSITKDTDITALSYDYIEVLNEDKANHEFDPVCVKQASDADTCDAVIPSGDYIRIVNVRNIPAGSSESAVIMKDINVIVLWKERNYTRSVSIRTMVGRKDSDFF